jgi:hypothetical protein
VTHRRVARRLSDYLGGSLSPREASRVEDHVAVCAECRTTLGELRQTVELLRGLRSNLEAPDVVNAVLARVRRGEADASWLDRWRAGASRFLAGPLGAPFATAAVGLLLFTVLPRIEVEVSIPGHDRSAAAMAGSAVSPTARVPGARRTTSAPLLALRVNESLSREPSRRRRSMPFACLESSTVEPCRDQHALMTRLAMDDIWDFLAQIEQVPEPRRDDWLSDLSRFAAESGDAADVAARLRATGDPRAQRLAIRFEEVR